LEYFDTLDCLPTGREAVIEALTGPGVQQRRLLELGFVPGGKVTALLESPWGDVRAYAVCGAVIALRRTGARQIRIHLYNKEGMP